MNEYYNDFLSLSKRSKIVFYFLLFISIPYKFFFLQTQTAGYGPDYLEYRHLADLFLKEGIIGYIKSNDPYTLWRVPMLPFVLYITKTNTMLYVIQLIFSYFLAYNFYKIFKFITKNSAVAFTCFFAILFLPYINNAACASLTEFLQVSFFIYSLRKVLYKQYDWKLTIVLSAFCLLRAEGEYFILFLILRELFLKSYKRITLYLIPICIVLLWSERNKSNFGTFSLVSPVMSSRALIGGLYGYIYTSDRNDFYTKYNYYDARDYVNKKEFIATYKKVVRDEIKNKLTHEPLDYAKIRVNQIAHAFLYFGFNLEHLPDHSWQYPKHPTVEELQQINSEWAYSTIFHNKDYVKLILRILYNGGLGFMHLFGFLFIFINYKKLLPLLFVLLNFSFVLFVEVDMRYLITIQAVCVCSFIIMSYSLIKYRTLMLN